MVERRAQIQNTDGEEALLISQTRKVDYGVGGVDTLREEDDPLKPTAAHHGQRYTNPCSWKCFGMLSVALLALVLTGVVSGVTVYHTLRSERLATYLVIGAYECNDSVPGTSFIHQGMTVGFESDTGSINYQCMPTDGHIQYYNKTYSIFNDTKVTSGGLVRYNTFREDSNNSAADCALCRIDGRDTIHIQLATCDCPNGWTKQYEGYLMSGGLCVHTDMKGWKPRQLPNDLYIYHDIFSNSIMDLYSTNEVLSCVVCTK